MNLITLSEPRAVGSFTVYDVTGVHGGECFLFVNGDVTILIDSGFGFSSEKLYKNIRQVLGQRSLDYILLTHSHFDHCLGSGYLAQMYPDLKIICSSYAGKILAKESARTVMHRLDMAAAEADNESYTDFTHLLHADIYVEDGDLLDLNGTLIRAVSLPGHTKCSTGFYFEKDKIFHGCETMGILCSDRTVMPSFLVGYNMTCESIKKAAAYDMNYYFIPHQGFILHDDCREFFECSRNSHIAGRDLIISCHKKGMNTNQIIEEFEKVFFTDFVKKTYPKSSFLENINIQIPLIINECG